MTKNKIFHYAVSGWFVALLATQLLLQVTGRDLIRSDAENRAKAALPAFQPNAEYIKAIVHYYEDHFALRDTLIALDARFRYYIKGKAPNEKAIIGKNNWLYYNLDNNIETYRNTKPFTESELAKVVETHLDRQKKLSKRGIQYVYIVGPNGPTIYPENLPDWATRKLNPHSRLDQVMDALHAHPELIAIDVRERLLKEKSKYRIYLNSDTHWNSIGAFIAYQEILNALFTRTKNPDLKSLTFEQVKIELLPPARGGDLARLLNLEDTFTETGDYSVTSTIPPNPKKLKALVFRDSFYRRIEPFFLHHFETTEYTWKEFDFDKIPPGTDVVLFEQVERTL